MATQIVAWLLVIWFAIPPAVIFLLVFAAKRADQRIGQLEWWSNEIEEAESDRLVLMASFDQRIAELERKERERSWAPSNN
jgi:hypothetical protein